MLVAFNMELQHLDNHLVSAFAGAVGLRVKAGRHLEVYRGEVMKGLPEM